MPETGPVNSSAAVAQHRTAVEGATIDVVACFTTNPDDRARRQSVGAIEPRKIAVPDRRRS